MLPANFDPVRKKLTDDPGALPDSGGASPSVRITALSVSGGVVSWTTSQAASSQVQYGASPNKDQTTAETDTSPLVTSHSVALSGLTVGRTYLFRVHSRLSGGTDGAGNSVLNGYNFFQDGQFVA